MNRTINLDFKYKLDTKYSGKIDIALQFNEYVQGGTAITMVSRTEGYPEPWTTLTTWIEGLKEDEVAIKNYSENEGMLEWAIENGIVARPHRWVPQGWVSFPVCKLLKKGE